MIFTLVYDYPDLKETGFLSAYINMEADYGCGFPQRFSEAEVLSIFKNNYNNLMTSALVCIIAYNSLTGDTKQVWNKYGGWKNESN